MKTKKVALSLFRHEVALAFRVACRNRLDADKGRSEDDLQRYVRKLERLLKCDPNNQFWVLLEKANLKLLKYLLQIVV